MESYFGITPTSGSLAHYGVKGMKWGVRRARKTSSSSRNKSYTEKQRKNDRAFYGAKGERRVNRNLNKGYGLRGARHLEVERRDAREKRKKFAKKTLMKGAKAASKAAATIGTYYLTDQIFFEGAGTKAAKRVAKAIGRTAVTAFMKTRGVDVRWRN